MKLTDLPPELQTKLGNLSNLDFDLLGIQARRLKHETELAGFPTEPKEAIGLAYGAMREDVSVNITEPADFISSGLNVVKIALQGTELDKGETSDLWQVLSLITDVYNEVKANTARARTALWVAARKG
jgi:hypothetical protein